MPTSQSMYYDRELSPESEAYFWAAAFDDEIDLLATNIESGGAEESLSELFSDSDDGVDESSPSPEEAIATQPDPSSDSYPAVGTLTPRAGSPDDDWRWKPTGPAGAIPPTQPTAQTLSGYIADNRTVAHLWGYLEPFNRDLLRIELPRHTPEFKIGRAPLQCEWILPDMRISALHCKLKWNERVDGTSRVTITDCSTNGTWVNGMRLYRGSYITLHDGDEVALAVPDGSIDDVLHQDNRYIFKHTASAMALGMPDRQARR